MQPLISNNCHITIAAVIITAKIKEITPSGFSDFESGFSEQDNKSPKLPIAQNKKVFDNQTKKYKITIIRLLIITRNSILEFEKLE